MRIATFNAENLFSRPAAMSYEDNTQGQPVIDDFHEINELLAKQEYTESTKRRIENLIEKYHLLDRRDTHENNKLILREIRGRLCKRNDDGTWTWYATGSKDFLGCVDLAREAIQDEAILNTARVIAEVSADIQILVEIEDRGLLQKFHDDILVPELKRLGKKPYKHILLMDGNDDRGIDVGLLSRVPVINMKSHVDLCNPSGKKLFARDCAQFAFGLPDREQLIVLGNHFSSKGSDFSGKKRREQAAKVRELTYSALGTTRHVIVAGDLNEPPQDGNLSSLLDDPELRDVMTMEAYSERAAFPGTYRAGSKSMKLDYLLLSKPLQEKVQTVGVERRGYWSTKWAPFPTVTKDGRNQASDHHCVWVDVNI
jgi:endonuclease/exonuclease/phosphatase family metal-dependent hydrolase